MRSLIRWGTRSARAYRLGVPYSRDKYWKTPTTLRWNSTRVRISLPNDEGTRIAFKDIFLEDVYGIHQIKSPIKTVIDVGAHAGLFSLYVRTVCPSAVIHAYEPNPLLWDHLIHQAKIGGFTPYPLAIGERSGRVALRQGVDTVFTQTCADENGEVSMIAVDEAIDHIGGTVSLLKLDCEGAEWGILEAENCLSRVSHLTLEYHLTPRRSLDELFSLVRTQGLEMRFHHADGIDNGRIWASRG